MLYGAHWTDPPITEAANIDSRTFQKLVQDPTRTRKRYLRG
jgi:hypothetical protein